MITNQLMTANQNNNILSTDEYAKLLSSLAY